MASRNDQNSSELAEMFVKRKRLVDSEAVHHSKANAVGETPRFITMALHKEPRSNHIVLGHPVESCDLARFAEHLLDKNLRP